MVFAALGIYLVLYPDALLALGQRIYVTRRDGLNLIVWVPRQKAHISGK